MRQDDLALSIKNDNVPYTPYINERNVPKHTAYDARADVFERALVQAEKRSTGVYPYLTLMEKGGSLYPGAYTGLVLNGGSLLGEASRPAVKASGVTDGATGVLTFTSVLPGFRSAARGNRILVTITDTGAALGVSASAAAGTVTVVHGNGGASSAAAIAAAINDHAVAKYLIDAAVTTAGTFDEDTSTYVASGATDPAYDVSALTIGDITLDGSESGCGITAWTDSAVTFDIDLSTYTDGSALRTRLWTRNVCLDGPDLIVRSVGKLVSHAVAAESGNAIAVTLRTKDLYDNQVSQTVAFQAEVRSAAGVALATAAMTITVSDGTGTVNGSAWVCGNTGSDGDVVLTVLDVSGSLAATVYLVIRVTTPGIASPDPIALTFA